MVGRLSRRRRVVCWSAALAVLPRAVVCQEAATTSRDGATAAVKSGQLVPRDSVSAFLYTRPHPFRAVTGVPTTLGVSARQAIRIRHVPMLLAVTASTVALIAADEPILAETRRMGQRVGLPPNHPSADLRVGAFKLAFPTTVGSGLYFLGDGLTSLGVAGGFAVRGTLADDTRARRTASEIVEALLASGTVTQVLKHVAGRQTPSEATVPRGRWRPLAPLGDYNANVPGYDAFPSGHLASTMATVTVIALNYPEHRFIWPVGSVAMGALAFSMVNNGVHWASDYPLALAIGGVVGKVVVERGRTVVRRPERATETAPDGNDRQSRVTFAPLLAPGFIGVSAHW